MECGTVVERPRKPAPEEVLISWAKGIGQGRKDSRLARDTASAGISGPSTPLGGGTLICLPWPQKKDELRDYEKLCATSEAFVYAAMSRLMLRRLAHARLFHTVSEGKFSEVGLPLYGVLGSSLLGKMIIARSYL